MKLKTFWILVNINVTVIMFFSVFEGHGFMTATSVEKMKVDII